MLNLFNKSKVPTNADPFNLTADLKTMAESMNVVIPIHSTEERNALPVYDGMTVCRLDRWDAPLETYSVAQGGWVDGWTGWYSISLASGFASQGTSFTPRFSRVGQTIFIEGAIKRSNGAPFEGGLQQITNTPLPEWVRPGSEIYALGAVDMVSSISRTRIQENGVMWAGGASGASYVFLTTTYRVGDMGALA